MRASLRLLLTALIAWGLVSLLAGSGRARRTAAAAPCDDALEACMAAEGFDDPFSAGTPEWTPPRLNGARVCLEAGYLCSGLDDRGTPRILRWNDDTREIRVRVPRPAGEESGRAIRLQRAAARGIRAWQGRPFTIRVTMSDRAGHEDFAVRWAQTLGAVELGEVQTEWTRVDGQGYLRVADFSLATRNPYDPTRRLDVEQVELTAAHEMGHALGLPHSDDERDVMFPSNTATRLTRRDYSTMQALYELENGAEIVGGR